MLNRGAAVQASRARFSVASAGVVALSVLLLAAPAAAENEAVTLDRGSALAALSWGNEGLALGLGARLGYTLNQGLYLGGLFDYWFGESQSVGVPGSGLSVSANGHAWDVLGAIGYDFGPSPKVVIRPYGGGGMVRATAETCTPMGTGLSQCVSLSASRGVGLLGGAVLANLDPVLLGGELRLMFGDNTVFSISANAGFVF